MITLTWVYALAGAVFAAFSLLGLRDRTNPKRWGTSLFWGLLALSMWAGDALGDLGNGILVLCLVAIAGAGGRVVGVLQAEAAEGIAGLQRPGVAGAVVADRAALVEDVRGDHGQIGNVGSDRLITARRVRR